MVNTPHFTEKEPYEKGFAEIFDQQIAPKLEDLEEKRLALLEKRRVRILLTILATGIGTGLSAWWIFSAKGGGTGVAVELAAIVAILLVCIPLGVGLYYLGELREAHINVLRQVIFPAVCQFFDGLEHTPIPGDRFDRERFTDHGVIPPFSWQVFQDLFVGRYRDTNFKMVQARIEGADSATTLFQGILFEIEVPMEFSGRVLIGRDKSQFGSKFKGYQKENESLRIQFDDAAFEGRYAVYASDAEEAKRLVSPVFRKNMLALADAYSEKSLGAAFVDSVFLLAVPLSKIVFQLSSIKRSVFDCEDDIHEFLREVTIPHRIIDYLLGERPELPD